MENKQLQEKREKRILEKENNNPDEYDKWMIDWIKIILSELSQPKWQI